MRTRKTFNGAYSCLHCGIEFDLLGEDNLRCDCGCLLVQGSLDEFEGEADDALDETEED